VSYKPLDAWVEALGAESGANRRTRIGRTGDSIQPVALPEWGSEYLAPPSSDSAFMYGSVEPAGTAANRPAALLASAANPANRNPQQRAMWFWYSVRQFRSGTIANSRVIMFVDGPGAYSFVGVGAGSQHAFDPGAIAATRTVFGGNSPTVATAISGLLSTTQGAAIFNTYQGWEGPFYCPQHLDVFFVGAQVGASEQFSLAVKWRELPILRG
jgi:hypothetical protein